MGATVSREHAKLPFGYTHPRKEDHSCTVTASSSLASRRQRLAHRLLLIKSATDSTSITPLPPHRLHITEDGGIVPGAFFGAMGEGGMPVGGGFGSPTAALSLFSHSSIEEADSENAEIVSLSSILNQGPEFELQWHAVGQDQEDDLFCGQYSNNRNDSTQNSGSNTNAYGVSVISEARTGHYAHADTDSGHESSSRPHSRSATLESMSHATSLIPASPRDACAHWPSLHQQGGRGRGRCDRETTADPCSRSCLLALGTGTGSGSGSGAGSGSRTGRDASLEIMEAANDDDLLQYACTTPSTVPTAFATAAAAAAIATAEAVSTTAFSLSCSSSQQDCTSAQTGPLEREQDEIKMNLHKHPQQNTPSERRRIHPTQHLQKHSFKTIHQDPAELTDTEEDEDSDEERQNMADKRKMDIISALGIADSPVDEGPEDIPFNFFDAEPTFHSLPDQYRLHGTTRRYTTDGGSYARGRSAGGACMDHDDFQGVVHLPQDLFEGHKHHLVADEIHDEDFDGNEGYEDDEDEYARSRRGNRGRGLGYSANSRSTATLGSSGFSLLNYSMMMATAPAPDEDVTHLSPIPFSELPSLTNIGLCSHGIVKLSSNIRLLSSATCLQICCNDLCSIPAEIGFLRNLTLLDLSKNSLTSLPDTIQYLTKLVDLKLSFNFLEALPSSIGELTKLTSLYLDNNRLTRLPSQIGLLKGLGNLDLDENPITVLPAEIGQLQYLRRLRLEGCPLVKEFVHSPVHSPPTLLELAARVVVRHSVEIPTVLPTHLKSYLKTSSQRCSFCNGPYFESSFKRGKLIEKNDHIIPLEYTLCTPHWNTEMERTKLLFGPRPLTAPPLPKPNPTTSCTVSSTTTTTTATAGGGGGGGGGVTGRRHTKSESAAATLTSTPASNGFASSSTTLLSLSEDTRRSAATTATVAMMPIAAEGFTESPCPSSSSGCGGRIRGIGARMRSSSRGSLQRQMREGLNSNVSETNNSHHPSSSSTHPTLPPSTKPRFSIRLKSRGERQQFSSP